jgi:ATP-dependent Clp protease ATP-binding subunit ClpC
VGAGSAEGSMDVSNILKPALARGQLQCIGATTLNEYRMYIEKDSALSRRFQMIIVEQPSCSETVEILRGIKDRYEAFHNVTYSDAILNQAVQLTQRYIPNRYFPDKAIDVMDEAGSRTRIDQKR